MIENTYNVKVFSNTELSINGKVEKVEFGNPLHIAAIKALDNTNKNIGDSIESDVYSEEISFERTSIDFNCL